MITIIREHLDSLRQLCEQYHVKRLEIFGSGADGDDFDSSNSDLDFLVEFQPLPKGKSADAYFGLLESLETLFDKHIDLVMTGAIKNRYFLEAIEKKREVLYAA